MLTLKNLSLTASDAQGRTDIVKNVSLDVEDGKFLVITGPNGGGKTTLAKLRRPAARSCLTVKTSRPTPSPTAPAAASPTPSSSRRGSRA